MNIPLKIWDDFFNKKGVEPNLKKSYLRYINRLNFKELPVVFELKHLSKLLGFKYGVLVHMVNQPEKYYYSFKIEKRSGGFRSIDAPYPLMRYAQFFILHKILAKVKIHDNAFAYLEGKSIVQNALPHLKQPHLLKMDLKDYFPTITKRRIIPIFQNLGYSNKVSYFLASLCCLNDCLPQGACTSPYISNIIAKRLDKAFTSLAAREELQYTRYADDLTFSGKAIDKKIIKKVEGIVVQGGFKVNQKKTLLIKGQGKKIVTGISVSGDKLKLPKSTRRVLRQELFYIKTYGLKNHLKKKKVNDPIYLERLIGKFHFWLQIEPKNEYVLEAAKYLKALRPETEDI